MIGDVVHPLSAVLFGPGVCEAVAEMSPVVSLSSFWDAVSPQDWLFKIRIVSWVVA